MKKAARLFFYLLPVFLFLTENQALAQQEALKEAETLLEEYPEKAVVLANEALENYRSEDDPAGISRAYFILGEAYFYMDDLQKAIQYYKMAVDTDEEAGNTRTAAHITLLGNLGYFYDHLDQKLIAMDYYEQALAIAREIGQKDEIAANLANIGQLKTLQGNYQEAVKCMEEALAIDRELGDEKIIAVDLNTLGRMYEGWGMFDKAVAYLLQALEIDNRLGLDERVAIRYNSLGLVYKSWGKYAEALESFQDALEIDRRLGNEEKVALRQSNIGSTYLAMGKADLAIEFLSTGRRYFEGRQMTSYMAAILNDLGKAWFLKQEYAKAEEFLMQSLRICGDEDYKSWRMSSLKTLSEVYSASGKHQEALDIYKQYVALKDSVFSAESREKLAEFQAKYDLYAREQENEMLRKDAELRQQRHTLTVLLFSGAGLMLVLGLLVLFFRLRELRNKKLLSEKENESLKKDLEIKNNELTYNAMCIIKNNESIARIANVVEDALNSGNDGSDVKQIIQQLQIMEADKGWKEFELRFTQTHRDFYDALHSRFPDLTPNERKLCAFLRLNMSSKDIASITHQSVHSINVARTRMRKKLGIGGTDENLVNFLQSI